MQNAHQTFLKNVSLDGLALYDYLITTLHAPIAFDDILRFQLVYAVSAFDTLNHSLIRIGMLQTFLGKRVPSPKYMSDNLKLSTYHSIETATIPPKEYFFEQLIIERHKLQSFQDPDKIAEGLSLIWIENHKWAAISQAMNIEENITRTTLKAIVDRRNKIVHESDINPTTGDKYPITRTDCEQSIQFIQACGSAIYSLVKLF